MLSGWLRSKQHRPVVAVFDADGPAALAFTRSLGRAGIPVRVYHHSRLALARLSRYCARFQVCPRIDEPDLFLPWLRDEVSKGEIALVAPTSDLMTFYMAELPDSFPLQQRFAVPSPERILTALLRHRFMAACEDRGIRVPWGFFPRSQEEVWEAGASLPYPVILRPWTWLYSDPAWRAVVVTDEKQLHRQFKPYPASPLRHSVWSRYPELRWPMIEEYIPQAHEHLYSVSGLFRPDGSLVAQSSSQKGHRFVGSWVVGCQFDAWEAPRAVRRAVDLARDLLGRGIFELELVYDQRTDEYTVLDLSPRAHRHIGFDVARNNDLPHWWYCVSMGEAVPAREPLRDDIRWGRCLPAPVEQILGALRPRGEVALAGSYDESWCDADTVDVVHDTRDPLPSLARVAQVLRSPRSILRPIPKV